MTFVHFFLTGKSKEIYFTWKVINGISNRLAEIVDKTDSFCLPRPPAFPNGGRGSPIHRLPLKLFSFC